MNPREYEVMREIEDDYWWYRGLRSLVAGIARRELAGIPEPRILDAGCGTGGTMAALRRALPCAHLTGLDYSLDALEFARARALEAELIPARVEALPFPDAHFDLLVSLDVLYTKGLDEVRALEEFHRVLKPGKCLLLNLPAFNFLRGEHDTAVHGARRYTRRGLRDLLMPAGFGLELLTYWNALLFPPIALWRAVSRRRVSSGEAHSDLHALPQALNTLLAWQLRVELWLARRIPLPIGTSIFAVARKLS